MQNLIRHIRKYVALPDDQSEQLSKWLRVVKVRKKGFLMKEGQVCNASFFVSKGCLRIYFIKENGAEQITQFAIENWWLSDYYSLSTLTPSSLYIQAIEDSEVILLQQSSEEILFKELPQLERYFRLVIQRAYAASQQRIRFLYEYSREELYHHFVSQFPEFMQRIPQYMLASYLGFTPEYLSELRKKKL